MEKSRFTVIIEKDEDGLYVASVPALPGCHTQAKDLDELDERIKEAIILCLEVNESENEYKTSFVGVHEVEVAI
jgi:predicted RNase H-like HicB family nuclease